MEENEIWKDIEGYEGLYEVSNMGRVKSLNYNRTNQEKILKQGKNTNGYMIVVLSKNGKTKTCQVHRLVANAFIGNPNNLPMINHKDECKTNNIVENLEWCTQQYNTNYGTAMQRMVANTNWKAKVAKMDYKSIGRKNSEKQRNDPNKSKKVYQYSLDLKLIKIWESIRDCGRNGNYRTAVSKCCRNCYLREGNNVYKGYIWSYEELK